MTTDTKPRTPNNVRLVIRLTAALRSSELFRAASAAVEALIY